MPSPFEIEDETPQSGSPFAVDVSRRTAARAQNIDNFGGFRRSSEPGYVFFPTGHVVRDADKKVWDPSTKSWYYMTEHGMSPEYGKASIPEQDDTRLDTLNLLRKIGSPVIPSQPQTQPQQQVQEPSRIGSAEDFVRQLWGKGKATMQKATAGTLHLIGGIQEEAGNLGIGLKKLASGQASQLTPDEARAITTAQAGGWQSAAALHALALAPQWQREAAQTTKGAAESLYQKGVESAAVEPRTAAGKVGAFVGGLAPHLTPLAPLTMAAEAGETGYRSALQEGAESETAILSGLAQAGVAGTLGSINRIGQLSKGGLKAVEPVLSKYPRLWSLLSKEVESGASGPATRWLGNLVRGSAKTAAEFAAGGMGMRGIAEAAKPQGGSPLSAAFEPTEIGKDILTGAAFHALPEVVKAATGPARAAFQERLQRVRELRGVGKGPSPEERLSAIKEAEKARVERQVQEAEADKPKPEAFQEVQPEEVGAYAGRELPEEVKAEILRKAQEGQGGKLRYPWEEEGMAPGEEYARSVVDEAARRRQEASLEREEAMRRPNREDRLSSLQRGMEEVPSQDGMQDRALALRDQLQSEFVPGGNTKESIRDLKVREGTRKELANLDAELGALPMQERRQMVADSVGESIREYESQYKMSPGSRRVKREIERLRDEQAKILSGEMSPERVLPTPEKRAAYTPRPVQEEPIAEARMGHERRIAEEPVDIERRSIERRQETKKSIEAEKRPEDMTQAELAEEVGRLRSERMLDSKVPSMANERAFNATYREGDPVASLDVRGLKATNKFGQHVGDEFLIDVFSRLNKIAKEEGAFAAHRSGDEGLVTHSDPAVLNRVIERTNQDLLKNPFTFVDERTGKETKINGEFHYGTATSPEAADRAMAAAKVAKAQPPIQPATPGRTEGVAPAIPGREPAHEARPEVLAAREQQRVEREAIKNSGLSKEERREAYKGITKLDTILRNESYPSSTEEATKVADMAASKVLPKGERAAAQVKLAEGMKAGTFPQFSDMKLKADGTPDMGAFLQALQAGFTGDGVMNPDGSKVVIAPLIEHDAAKTAESVRRDLSWVERLSGRIGSTSHVYTGTWSLGTSGEKGAKTIGALDGVNNPATDKHLGMASAFGNTVHVAQHLTDTLTKYSIPNNHFRLLKELKPTNEYWSKAVKEYNAAEESYAKNKSVTTERAFEIAKEKVADARKVVYSHLREIYSDPSYGDARVMAYADATRGGKAAPEWLESLMSKSEKGAALEITNQMNEIKRALTEAGIPVREDYGVPHTIKAWMKGTDFKRAYDPETGKINPESLEFKHRSDQSILTMPDAYGMIEDYIPHTMSLIAKRNVANKWDYVARELEATNPRLSEQIKHDMSSYTKGEGAVHEWMDKVHSWFANYLVGYRTATAVKHLAKYPLELANASPIKSAMGWVEFKREVAKNPELKRIMDEMTRAAKGPRYNAYPDLGTGEDVTGVAKGVGQKISASSHYPMQFVEGALRSNTFRMDLLGNIKKGMSPREAVADAVFRSLMVNFQASDKPMIMRSSMGRSIFFLQQTVWKIMECNVRAATDAARGIKRGAETTFTGEKLSAEEKGRYSQAARHMAALVAMYYIGKQTNTKLFDWISESPSIIKAIITRPLMVMTKNAVAKAKGEETDWHYDPTDELMSGISATQAFQNIEKSAKEYGFGSKGFWLNLTPLALQDIALEPSKYQQQKTGTGAEALFRRVTGLTKMEEEEEAKEKMQKKTRKKQESKSEKLVQRLRNPLEVIAPAVQESETSPFDKE